MKNSKTKQEKQVKENEKAMAELNIYLKRNEVFMQLQLKDLIAFFDIVNSISAGAERFVTDNELLLAIKDKIEARINNFKVISEEEFDSGKTQSLNIGKTKDYII